jgi:hypothetical protein
MGYNTSNDTSFLFFLFFLRLDSTLSIISSVGENPNLCGSGSCKTKKNSTVVPLIVASVGGLLILSLVVAAILFGLSRRRKQQGKTKVENFKYIHIDIN